MEMAFKKDSERELYLLALVEAINNAAEHGNRGITERKIKVRYFFKKNIAGISVLDEGSGFNPVFPDLKKVTGKRGRGLGFIKAGSDAFFFNRKGNRLTFLKGCCTMEKVFINAKAKISKFPNVVVLITDLEIKKHSNVASALIDIFESLNDLKQKKVLIDLKKIRILDSLTWGAIFSEAEKDTDLILLFNVNKAIQKTASQLGIKERKDIYSKIKINEDDSEALKILAKEDSL